ncbi:MAG: DUF2894 domain-containing protein [Rhodoferax sp.]|nr:DUF2894 domain-containing protein [Rhodoferax sp.]
MTAADCAQALANLRQAGAALLDAVQLHYLERLLQRLQTQSAPVQQLLLGRLAQAITEFEARLAAARSTASQTLAHSSQQHPEQVPALQRLLDSGDFKELARRGAALEAAAPASPLADLLQAFAQHQPPAENPASSGAEPARPELKAVRQFRSTWSRLHADQQMKQALEQAPQNAGPINSHMLVLRSLALMRDIAPDYLNRFMAYADSLLCLQQLEADRLAQAQAAVQAAAGKKPKPRRAKARP